MGYVFTGGRLSTSLVFYTVCAQPTYWALHREVGRGEQLWPAAAVAVSLLVERPARGLWEFCGSPPELTAAVG